MLADFLVVGGGIAGASAGYELAAAARVVVLERESQPGYHATGRSAAVFTTTYGPPPVRALARASQPFLAAPPADFAEAPLLSPRDVLLIARADQLDALRRAEAAAEGAARRVDADAARRLCPPLAEGYAAAALHEAGAADIDVHALHQGYLRALRRRGGEVVTNAEVIAMHRADGLWRLSTTAGDFAAPVVVNAAGAWGDDVARRAGVPPLGLMAKRRTVALLDLASEPHWPQPHWPQPHWPMTIDVDEAFYFKPDGGGLLASPADATPLPPCDVQPEEIDIARAVDRIERATGLAVRRIRAKWAGLRTFAPGGAPVAGFGAEGFFWLVGQGGYGIMTAPALARAAAALARGEGLPADLDAEGVRVGDLVPG